MSESNPTVLDIVDAIMTNRGRELGYAHTLEDAETIARESLTQTGVPFSRPALIQEFEMRIKKFEEARVPAHILEMHDV